MTVLDRRYLVKDRSGRPAEDPDSMFRRVARDLSLADLEYGASQEERQAAEDEFHHAMRSLDVMPNSPTLMNAGRELQQLSACFVLPVEDSLDSIFDQVKRTALIHKSGGGTGFSFSRLRPAGDAVGSTGGVASGPVSFIRAFDTATDVVKQGGTRRGANMGILNADHPDIMTFIESKRDGLNLNNFNISVAVTGDFMEKVRTGENYDLINPRTGGKKGSLNAREVFDRIAQMAWETGDPGLIFIDRVNRDNPNPQLGEIESTNPCVTGDTWIHTSQGLRRAIDIHLGGDRPGVVTDGRFGAPAIQQASAVWSSGHRHVFRLTTQEGYETRVTPEHRIMTDDGWVRAGELQPGQSIHILNREGGFGNDGSREMGEILGLADRRRRSQEEPGSPLFLRTEEAPGASLRRNDGPQRAGARRPQRKLQRRRDGNRGTGRVPCQLPEVPQSGGRVRADARQQAHRARESIPGNQGHAGRVPQRPVLRRRAREPAQENGSGSPPDLHQPSDVAGRATAADQPGHRLPDPPRRRPARATGMPDGRGGNARYNVKAYHKLLISRSNLVRFQEQIGFLDGHKRGLLDDALESYQKGPRPETFTARFKAMIPDGEEEVFDLTEPVTHSFIANGMCVSNCGEQALLPYESCNLASVNLARMVIYPESGPVEMGLEPAGTGGENHRPHVGQRDRPEQLPDRGDRGDEPVHPAHRLGVMGFSDLLVQMGIPYDSEEGVELARRVMRRVRDLTHAASSELAGRRGNFPTWEGSIYNRAAPAPMRNSAPTTIAPTGTISIIAGASSGIEPLFALSYVRSVMDNTRMVEGNPHFEAVARSLGFHSEELMEELARTGTLEGMDDRFGVPGWVKRVFRTSHDISPEWHVRMQAAFQEHTDNSVSKTINFPREAGPRTSRGPTCWPTRPAARASPSTGTVPRRGRSSARGAPWRMRQPTGTGTGRGTRSPGRGPP